MFAKYFTGQAYLARLTRDEALNCPVSNVTFEPGCRNNWHSHTGGQLLVAVSGPGVLSGEGRTCAGIAAGRRGRDRPRRGALARRGPRQLVFAPGRRDQPADEPQYVAGAGRRRASMPPATPLRLPSFRSWAPRRSATVRNFSRATACGTGGDGSRINRNF